MPLAATICNANGNPAGGPWSIEINGNDYALTAATAGHKIGIPVESLELDLEGAGGVSSCSFAIDDPDRLVTIAEGDRVWIYDHTREVPRFAGWIQAWTNVPMGIGRQVHVEAQGREAILDWAFIPGTLTIPAGTDLEDAALACAGAALYPQGVELLAFAASSEEGSAYASAGIGNFFTFDYHLVADAVITDTTLRDALNQVASLTASTAPLDGHLIYPVIKISVDFWGYLRVWVGTPGDWADVSTSSGFGSASPAPADPQFLNDAAGACHAVYVVGGNAAGTGMVTDGTGIPGPIARINDSTITTQAGKDAAGLQYMANRTGIQRAPLRLEDFVPAGSGGVAHPRPGAKVQIRDAQLGIDPAVQYLMDGITISFSGGGDLEQWEISAGGRRPSAVNYIRRLTRGVKSA